MFTFFVVLLRKFVLVPLLACLFSSLGTELSGWGQERIMPPRKLGLDLQLDGEETVPTAESDKQVWLDKVKELAGRGITIRQLLDFYVDLGHEVMKHFDPKKSTTHDAPCSGRDRDVRSLWFYRLRNSSQADVHLACLAKVVRQAIIPRSLQLRDSRYLVVVVHRATGLSSLDLFSGSDPYCVVSVQGSGGVSKPWKGGGRTPYVSNDQNPVWEESFLVEDQCESCCPFLPKLPCAVRPRLQELKGPDSEFRCQTAVSRKTIAVRTFLVSLLLGELGGLMVSLLEAALEDVLHEEVLYFSLWDHDFASKDDPLGNASLPDHGLVPWLL